MFVCVFLHNRTNKFVADLQVDETTTLISTNPVSCDYLFFIAQYFVSHCEDNCPAFNTDARTERKFMNNSENPIKYFFFFLG